MEISQRDRRAIILGGIGLGVVVLYLLIIEPTMNYYDNLVDEHTVLAAKVARVMRDKQKQPYMKEHLKECEDRYGSQSEPQSYSQQITMVSERLMIASRCGVKLKNSHWAAAKPWADDPTLELAQIQLDTEGNWASVGKFLGELYRLDGVLGIEQMDMSGDPKKGGKITLRLTVSVLVKSDQQNRNPWAK
jgi:type II secretion system (T2SS) protein M